MLYRPTFCCDCGNKIERTKWRFWTSRRFCENCETEFRKEEWLPTVFLSFIALVGGLYGFGSYLKTPEKPLALTSNRASNSSVEKTQNKNVQEIAANSAKTVQPISGNTNQNAAVKNASASLTLTKTESLQNTADEPVYFCGAQTKKGTPCGRKVRGGGRCWQHTGQPAMLPKDKLVAMR
jgi:hypothetical protein